MQLDICENRKWDLIFKKLSEGLSAEENKELLELEEKEDAVLSNNKRLINLVDYEEQLIGE